MKKKVCLQVGHWNIRNLQGSHLRNWRSVSYLRRSTGASGEAKWHQEEWMPRIRDELIKAGVEVYIVDAIYHEHTYDREYDLWISGHYDGGGDQNRAMIAPPNKARIPNYLNSGAQKKAQEFCQIWKQHYPSVTGAINRDERITAGMRDYYAFDFVGLDTPSVIVEHFNHTSDRGEFLKKHPELVVQGDFEAILDYLDIEVNTGYTLFFQGKKVRTYKQDPEKETKSLKDENNDLEEEIENCKENVQEYQGKLEEAQKKEDKLERQIVDLREQTQALNQGIDQLEAEKEGLDIKLSKAEETIEKLESEQGDKELLKRLTRLSVIVEGLRADKETLSNQISGHQVLIKDLRKERKKIIKELAEQVKKNKKLEKKLAQEIKMNRLEALLYAIFGKQY